MAKKPLAKTLARWRPPISRDLAGGLGCPGALSSPRAALSGTPVTHRSALSVAAVYQAVSVYVNTLGALKSYIAEIDDRGGRRPAPYHPAYDVVRTRPNPFSTAMRFRQAWIGHALTYGNGYAEIVWDSKGRTPLELHLMDPRDIEPCQENGTVVYRQKGGGPDLPMEDVLHLAMFGWDGLRGYSPIGIGAETIGVAAAQRQYQSSLFANSAGIRGHIEVPGKMSAVAKADLLNEWEKKHQGVQSAGTTGVLDEGGKWVATSFSPQDAELILGARFSVEEIARIYNLPPHKLGVLENASYSTVEQANIEFFQTSLLPWLTAIEEEYDLKIFGRIERNSYFVTHDLGTLLKGDSASQRAQEQSDLATGVQSINEIRVGRGLDVLTVAQADYHFVPTNNLSPVELMPKPGQAPAPALAAPQSGPTPDPKTPALAPATVLRGVLADPINRMIRKECQAARTASGREGFAGWPDKFYPRHAELLAEALTPAIRALNALSGLSEDPGRIAAEIVDESRATLRGLASRVAPGELAAEVERQCEEWESARADRWADALIRTLPIGAKGHE